jgi:hypothetical protein
MNSEVIVVLTSEESGTDKPAVGTFFMIFFPAFLPQIFTVLAVGGGGKKESP